MDPPDYGPLDAELADRDADAFVHVGGRSDDTLRYLARIPEFNRSRAFVYDGGEATLVVPRGDGTRAGEGFPGRVVAADRDPTAPGRRAAELLAGGRVLVPRDIPHDAAVWLERAGCEPTSTDAVERMRARKTDAEIDRIRVVQEAVRLGMARGEALLAGADVEGGRAVADGDPLTTEGLRRAIDAELVRQGVRPAGNTEVRVGSIRVRSGDRREIPPDATVVVSLSPRGPRGYHGALVRTFVAESAGGWERRASVAVESARRAGLAELEAGVEVESVRGEVIAEAGAFGFDAAAPDPVRGIGLARRESPLPGETVPSGAVVVLAASVADPAEGAVAVADPVVVGDDASILGDYPLGITPRPDAAPDSDRDPTPPRRGS